jgi:hypothetical protein
LLLLKPLRALVGGINNIKVGDFQLSLQKIGESLGVPTSVDDISSLNYEDLRIFLIMCGEDSDYYIFTPANITAGKFGQILNKLASNGLIEAVEISTKKPDQQAKDIPSEEQAAQQPTWRTYTTEKGRKVHRALLDSIYEQLLNVKTSGK